MCSLLTGETSRVQKVVERLRGRLTNLSTRAKGLNKTNPVVVVWRGVSQYSTAFYGGKWYMVLRYVPS